jgi:hypothetical protein
VSGFDSPSASGVVCGLWRCGSGRVSDSDPRSDRTLELAAAIVEILDELGVASALIGAAALAAHGYPRATEDVDLAVAADPFSTLREAQHRITKRLGVEASLSTPDADDPLGGVLTVTGEGVDPVQVVNFQNPLAPRQNPGAEAVRTAVAGIVAGTRLRVVDLPHLVALKLYAGGYKSQLDVLALLERNPRIDREEIAGVCERFGLGGEWSTLLELFDG